LRAEAAAARAQRSDDQALIAHLKPQIEKLNRDRYGPRSERTAWLLDKLEMTLEELEASVTEEGLAAEMAAAKTMRVASFTRKRPSRKPFPEHLPRERLIVPGPTACACCGGSRLSKLLEVIPTKSWKVIQHIREKFTAGIARRSARLRRRSTSSPAAGPDRACWRWSCSRSLASISRCPVRPPKTT
jgi:hypothetical protein